MKKWLAIVLVVVLVLVSAPFVVLGAAGLLLNGRTPSATNFAQSAFLAEAPPPLAEAVTLKVVTYNVQFLWVVGQNRAARARALGEVLTAVDADIVCFQEAFTSKDRMTLIDALAESRLQHHAYFPSATMGSGLMISSAYPIEETFFHRYTVSNPWYKIWEGDWWAGKGAGLARVKLPGGTLLDVYDTHAQAAYGPWGYKDVRIAQMGELVEFMKQSRAQHAPALLLGDMNAAPGRDVGYETIVDGAGLVRLMNINSGIDHIFGALDDGHAFEVLNTVKLSEHNGLRLSDHNGYASTIRITPSTVASS